MEEYSGHDDAESEDKFTAPFSQAELKAQNFTYAALGHYHDFSEARTESGLLIGAYSGCLGGRNFYETGPRSALLGTIEPGRPGRWNVQIEQLEFDNRRLIMVAMDVTGLSVEDLWQEIVASIEEQGGRAPSDLVYLHLEGRHGAADDPEPILGQLRQTYPELIIFNNARPDYLAETHAENTPEWGYIQALLELKRRVERARTDPEVDAESHPLSGSVVEDALYYGLDALKQRRIIVRNVD
jgi:DNA repair exonuclease SbcCD nuclease subunit